MGHWRIASNTKTLIPPDDQIPAHTDVLRLKRDVIRTLVISLSQLHGIIPSQ